jgi:hypothetical protein
VKYQVTYNGKIIRIAANLTIEILKVKEGIYREILMYKCITTQIDSSLTDFYTGSSSPSHVDLCCFKVSISSSGVGT